MNTSFAEVTSVFSSPLQYNTLKMLEKTHRNSPSTRVRMKEKLGRKKGYWLTKFIKRSYIYSQGQEKEPHIQLHKARFQNVTSTNPVYFEFFSKHFLLQRSKFGKFLKKRGMRCKEAMFQNCFTVPPHNLYKFLIQNMLICFL